MAPASLSPAFFRMFYSVANLIHVQTMPTRAWSAPSEGHPKGTFINWDETQIDADDMVQAYAGLLTFFFNDSSNLDSYVIYTQADAEADPLPRAGNAINLAGVNTSDSWFQAVQQTWSYRDTEFHKFKLVMLEVPTSDVFSKSTSLPGSGPLFDLNAFLVDPSQSFSSRWGHRPDGFVSICTTLNEKLRKERRLN